MPSRCYRPTPADRGLRAEVLRRQARRHDHLAAKACARATGHPAGDAGALETGDRLGGALAVGGTRTFGELDRIARALHRAVRRLQRPHDFQTERAAGARLLARTDRMSEVRELEAERLTRVDARHHDVAAAIGQLILPKRGRS